MSFWRVLLWSSVALVALVVVGHIAWSQLAGPEAVGRGLAAARPWFAAWRFLLYVVVFLGWAPAVDRNAEYQGWEPDHAEYVQGLRWRVAIWLILFEMVLAQNVVGRFLEGLA